MPPISLSIEQEEAHLAVRDALRRHFGVTSLCPLHSKGWNFAFRGVGLGSPLFIKVLRPGPEGSTNGAVETGARVASELAIAGMESVTAPLPNAYGKLVTQVADKCVLVYPWVQCIDEDSRSLDERLRAAARLLARLHVELEALNDSSLDQQLDAFQASPFSYSPMLWFMRAEQMFGSAKERLNNAPGVASLLIQAEAATLSLAEERGQLLSSVIKSQFLHGDYRYENLLPTLDGYRIIDFDMCHSGEITEDVAYAALAFSGDKWLMGVRNRSLIARFLRTYNAERRSLHASEICMQELSAVLLWTVLKAISLSYKAEQVVGRWRAFQSISRFH